MLMAQPLDPATARLSGTAFTVTGLLAGLELMNNPGEYSATADGVLVHAAGGTPRKLTWRDRGGKLLAELAAGAEIATPRISPDGHRVAFAFARGERENMDIWVTDLAQKFTRVTSDPATDRFPVWSPDGRTITFASGEGRRFGVFRKASDGTGSVQQLIAEPFAQHPLDWSPDGKTLLFTRNDPNTDLMILPAGGQPYIFLRTHISEAHSQLNPVVPRWIAYSSDDSGRREIYVREFVAGKPAGDALWPISDATGTGGTMPRWRRDGRELYYWALDGRIMAVEVNPSGSMFKSSTPTPLFQVQPPTLRTNDISFDVTPDGRRFVIIEPVERLQLQPLHVVTDWLASVKR
jgi:dipeptidyl aminopeptidase/acylaminoacyl peptidase